MLFICLAAVLFAGAGSAEAQRVKRVIIVKIDGLPQYYVDKFVKETDPATGKSMLPWFEEVFYKHGTRVPNFYTRGMSLSGPSWGQIDTGQHLQIKGNVEYDRYTLHPYDYLNFFPYYIGYGLNKKADMPAVEVMDQLGIPLLSDAFTSEHKYTAQQLYQRGNDWAVLASGFVKLYPGNVNDLIDEWTIGFDFRRITIDQVERDILGKVVKRDQFDYFDYYDTAFDHVSHHNNDAFSRLTELKRLDRLIGRIWTAVQASPRADETALVLVSDHGFNSEEKVYSQGFNLVKLLASRAGGGHHVITKRRLLLDYSIKGIYPLVPLIRTSSADSYYLKGEVNSYPTALVDFDGNERSSIHLRDSDLNVLHILLESLKKEKMEPRLRTAVTNAFFKVIDRHREEWQQIVASLSEELGALDRWVGEREKIKAARPKPREGESRPRAVMEQELRENALTDLSASAEKDYREYLATLSALLALRPESFDPEKVKVEDIIGPGAMGQPNTINELQNYVVGAAPQGFRVNAAGGLDMEGSFVRVNYFDLLSEQRVRNNVQDGIGSRPIDFVAVRLPVFGTRDALPEDARSNENPIWLSGGPRKQALILTRVESDGTQSYRYMPVSGLRQDENGRVTLRVEPCGEGFPLKYFEDPNLKVPNSDRCQWLTSWHSELEWFRAVHKTFYSNAIIGLNEQVDRHPIFDGRSDNLTSDEKLIRRLRQRQRALTEADMLILASFHWNFDVRGFNPGGNHGSFFRVSTNSTLMMAGGAETGIPQGLAVAEPYDNLSFAPTILRLMGKVDDKNQPIPELKALGFRGFPGRVITEVTGRTSP